MISFRIRWPRSAAKLALGLAFILSGCTRHGADPIQRVVVKVNTESLRAGEFSELLASRLKVFNTLSAKDTAVIAQAKKSVVQDFIVRVVTQDWAQKNQIFVRKEQIDKEIQSFRDQYPDDIAFRKSLADEGITYDQWESRLKFTLLERMVSGELRKNIPKPTTEEAKAYFQSHKSLYQQPAAVRIRQIVLDTDVNAQRVKKLLASGKSLSSLAEKFSLTQEGKSGGDVGWVERGTLDVFDAAFRMNVGQRSQIVKSPFGYHIFEVTAKRPAKAFTFEEVRDRVDKNLIEEKEQQVYSTWLEEQILKARVFKDDEFLNQIQVQTRSIR